MASDETKDVSIQVETNVSNLITFGSSRVVIFIRWITFLFGLFLFFTKFQNNHNLQNYIAIFLIALLTIARTFYPIKFSSVIKIRLINFTLDLIVLTLCVVLTDQFNSPFIFTILPVLILLGVSEQLFISTLGSLIVIAVITEMIYIIDITQRSEQSFQLILQNVVILVSASSIGTAIGEYIRDTSKRSELVQEEMKRMGKANSLLLALHDVAQTMPASLDLAEVLATTKNKFNDLYDVEYLTILVGDATHNTFRVELAQGVRLNSPIPIDELPAPLRQTLTSNSAILHKSFDSIFPGCSKQANSGMYVALRARGNVVGIISIEHSQANRYSERDRKVLSELAEPLALSIDNGLWFARLKNLGAQEERNRIARDLHDRLAQALAYVAFELERLIGIRPEETELVELRDIVREVVGDLRETLYELRSDIDASRPFHILAQEYMPRFGDRTGLDIQFDTNITKNILPIQIERELWRITQEALNNVNKHAEAEHIWVTWTHTKNKVLLSIRDDGKGFDLTNRKNESFGLIGMRERADTIHAQLKIMSHPGKGTTIETEVEVPK